MIVHSFVIRRGEPGKGRVCQKGKGFRRWQWVPEDQVVGRVESVEGPQGDRCITRGPGFWRRRVSGHLWALLIILFEGFSSMLKKSIRTGRSKSAICKARDF